MEKYGIIVYEDTDNIGDDILSYAALKLMPRVDYYIERETLDLFMPKEDEQVFVLMNGWYMHHKTNWPPSPYIYPLLMGVHFAHKDYLAIGEAYLTGLGKAFLKEYEPIGCRDSTTLALMKKQDIEAYFSGCLTLTLRAFEGVEKKAVAYVVDVSEKVFDYATEKSDIKVIQLSHYIEPSQRNESREEKNIRVESYLKKYQEAAYVVTSRLHVALPCLALGTPVLLINEERDLDRFSDYLPMLHHCGEARFLKDGYNNFVTSPPRNKETFQAVKSQLLEVCHKQLDPSALLNKRSKEVPNRKLYTQYWLEKAGWQKQLMALGRNLKEEELVKYRQWELELRNTIEWYKNNTEEKEATINALQDELTTIKEWLEERNNTIEYLETKTLEEKKYVKRLEMDYKKLRNNFAIKILIKIFRLDRSK